MAFKDNATPEELMAWEAGRKNSEIRSQLIKVAADLISGKWSSQYMEDNPPRTPKLVLKSLQTDSKRRHYLANILKQCADKL